MQKIVALALVATVIGAFPLAAPSFAAEQNTSYCGPDAPAAHKRPGGFCEQLKDTKSMGSERNDDDFFFWIVL